MKSVRSLLAPLIQTPSQALVNDPGAMVKVCCGWLDAHGVPDSLTGPGDKPDAIVINRRRPQDEEVCVLDACVDTAPVGDMGQWQHAPFAALEAGGWICGRGSADSKVAWAIFCGNCLAMHGTQVLSGFGVDFKNIHGPDECGRMDSIAPLFRVYRAAARACLAGAAGV